MPEHPAPCYHFTVRPHLLVKTEGNHAIRRASLPDEKAEKLAQYCQAQGIRWLATYDAAIVRRNYPGADLFLLVEFEEGRRVGREFFKIGGN